MFALKPFQENAISQLRKSFLELWQTEGKKLPLVFKSPTGSGKTVMVAQFLKNLTGDPQFDADKAFLWFSFSEDSYVQSKKKLFDYYGGASELELLDLNDLNRGKLQKNNIFFINWQKIKASTKEGRKLRKDNEQGINFDNLIKATQADNRKLVLIIDEAHRDTDTKLAADLIDLINPKIILKITATPKSEPSISDVNHKRAGFVEADREEVVKTGLIKEKIITQTKEDLEKISKKEIDQDLLLLELAYNKRLKLKKYYKDLKLNINPLILIQLPNDDRARKETLDKSKLDIVKDFLKDKGVDEHNIAIWLSNKKEYLEKIEKNNSEVSFLIFKQAAATGWDCPRASVLIMFREIKNPIFKTQTLGRILRMPEANHYLNPELNVGYLYTNYNRNQIITEYNNKQGENKPFIYESKRKDNIEPIILDTVFMSRTDYNDLGYTFQQTFKQVADKSFNIKKDDSKETIIKKLKELEIDKPKIKNSLIIDAEIENYDNFVQEIKTKGKDIEKETSRNDLERLYNLLCFNILIRQEDEDKKFAPERSWGDLKSALNVWLSGLLKTKREDYYKIIVNDLLKPDSKLRPIISESLAKYRPIREQEVKQKALRTKRMGKLEIPRQSLFYTDEYKELEKIKKSAMKPFYIKKDYNGKNNETKFIKYLEAKKEIEWWYKNGDCGSDNFAISYYYDEQQNKEGLFYPDWIIKANGKIVIIDTKRGITTEASETKYKAEALQRWLKKQKGSFMGGIAVEDGENVWKINKNKKYSYNKNLSGWELLNDILK